MFRVENQKKTIKVAKKDQKIFWKKASKKRQRRASFVILIALMTIAAARWVPTPEWSLLEHWFTAKAKMAELLPDFTASASVNKEAEKVFTTLKASEDFSEISVGRSLIGKYAVRVIKQKPLALLNAKGFHRVDGKGAVVEHVKDQMLGTFPILSGSWNEKEIDALSEVERYRIKEGTALIKTLTHYGIAEDALSELFFDDQKAWVVFMQKPRVTVVFGKENFVQKAKRLARVLKKFQPNMNAIKSIDLDYGQLAIVKFKGGENGQS